MRKAAFFPLKSSLANAKAARVMTISIKAVVTTVNINVFRIYFPKGTVEKASM
jgi:hypothetical protein